MQKLIQRVTPAAIAVSLVVIATAVPTARGYAGEMSLVQPGGGGSPGASAQPNPGPGFPNELRPFQTGVSINIADTTEAKSGSFVAPTGGELVIQTVSMYRHGAYAAGSSVQLYIGVLQSGVEGFYAIPPAGDATTGTYPGATWTGVLYADPGSTVIINDYRTSTSGAETDVVAITGYVMVKGPVQPLAVPGAR